MDLAYVMKLEHVIEFYKAARVRIFLINHSLKQIFIIADLSLVTIILVHVHVLNKIKLGIYAKLLSRLRSVIN